MSDSKNLHLFQGFGIELEYMIVDAETLNIKPISDQLIKEVAGDYLSEIDFDKISWSNELMLHLIELKTNGPCASLAEQPKYFQQEIERINDLLAPFSAKLMPTGCHPWMNPHKEARLWPHEYNPIYETYHQIFNCTGHGWANVQSTHLNLPFASDEEFARLHTAIRLLLPIMSVLSASTPIIEGKLTGYNDTRLQFYCNNQDKVPSISGLVVPEVIESQAEYEDKILKKMYHDIAPHDPQKILQYEWLNSRGAIARFDRNTVEIRVLDVQEAPLIDIAILAVIVEVLKHIIAEKWLSFADQKKIVSDQALYQIFLDCLKNGSKTAIINQNFLKIFSINNKKLSANELWAEILVKLKIWENPSLAIFKEPITNILEHGNLSERIIAYLNKDFSKKKLHEVYEKLCQSLKYGESFYV